MMHINCYAMNDIGITVSIEVVFITHVSRAYVIGAVTLRIFFLKEVVCDCLYFICCHIDWKCDI